MAFANPIGSTIAVGRQARISINGSKFCFASAEPRSTREIVTNADASLCGDIDTNIKRTTPGRQIVGWNVTIDVTWPIVEKVFPLLGNTGGATGPWSLGATDNLTQFPVKLDLVGEVHSMTNCFCSSWELRGQKGSRPVQMSFEFFGETETAGSFTGTEVAFGAEYAFTQSSMTIEDDADNNQARAFDRFILAVKNNPVIEYNNSITMTDALIGNREAMFATSVPYVAANKDLYMDHRDSTDGRAVVFTLDNGEKELEFNMPACQPVTKPASAISKLEQIRTPVTMMLMRDDDSGTRVSPLTITASVSP